MVSISSCAVAPAQNRAKAILIGGFALRRLAVETPTLRSLGIFVPAQVKCSAHSSISLRVSDDLCAAGTPACSHGTITEELAIDRPSHGLEKVLDPIRACITAKCRRRDGVAGERSRELERKLKSFAIVRKSISEVDNGRTVGAARVLPP